MRRALALPLMAGLFLVMLVPALLVLATALPIRPAWAQEIAVGEGARVEGAAGTRINVRAAPVIESGNVLAQASGGALVRVLEASPSGAYTWYRVASLPDAATAFEGWIRGDLLRPAALPERTLPEVLAETHAGTDDAAAAAGDGRASVPFDQRTDWSRNLLALYPAIEGCVRVGSAPPITVLRATTGSRNRDIAEVVMSDTAGRRWSCLIDVEGGTPIRYDPLSGSLFLRDRLASEPFFSTAEERPALDPACYRFERVEDPSSSEHLGWLYYRTCP